MHIGEAVHAFADERKVLGVIAHVEHNELGPGVAGQNVVPCLQQLSVTWKIAAVKGPIWMIIQFLEALIETIGRKEESLRIRNVNRHRHAKRSACFPHGIETWIVNFYQWALRDSLTQIKTQRLKNFQSARACLVCPNNLIGLELAISRLICAFPPRFRERYESFWMGLLKLPNRFL